jgi:hypothetical protein
MKLSQILTTLHCFGTAASLNSLLKSADNRQKLQHNKNPRAAISQLRGGAVTMSAAMETFTTKVAPTLGTFLANGMFAAGLPAIQVPLTATYF